METLSLGGVTSEGDAVEIFDGADAAAPLLRRFVWYSSWSTPPTVRSHCPGNPNQA